MPISRVRSVTETHQDVDHAGHGLHHLRHAGDGVVVVAGKDLIEGVLQGGHALVDVVLVLHGDHIAAYLAGDAGGGGVGQVDAVVAAPLLQILILLGQHPHDGEGRPVYPHGLPHGTSAEVGPVDVGADDAHLGAELHVAVLEVAAAGDGGAGDVHIVLADALDGGGAHRIRADLHIAVHGHRGGALVQVLAVLVHDPVHLVHAEAAGGAPGGDGDGEGVGAQAGEAVGHILLQAVAQAHDDDHRRHADDDAQHGQQGAGLAGEDVLDGQGEGFQDAQDAAPPSVPAARGVTTASGASAGPS